MLPNDNGALVQVGDVGSADALGVLLENHPADVRVEETLADGVGILVGVGVSVVSTVVPGPPPDGALNSAGADGSKVDLERKGGLVGLVSPQSVVTSGDAKTGVEVVDDAEDGGVELEGNPVRGDETHHGDNDDEGGVEPVHMLVPVAPCYGGLRDVSGVDIFLRPSAPEGDIVGGAIREGGGDVDAGRLARHLCFSRSVWSNALVVRSV